MPGPQAPLYGKTAYRYVTRDGGPPNKGAPPSSSSSSAPPQYSLFPPPGQFCQPPSQRNPFLIPPGSSFPGAFCVPNGQAFPAAPTTHSSPVWFQPQAQPPPPPQAHICPTVVEAIIKAAPQNPEPPFSGNRVKGHLLDVKDSGAGHLVGEVATFHIFTYNVIDKYTVNASNQFYVPPNACEPFRIMTASYHMPIGELIKGIDCVSVAPPGYPNYAIGIAEAFDIGNGWFQVGSKIHLSDEEKCKSTIKHLWGESIGEQGQSRPRYIIRLPGKQAGT